jgi:hypothetical protein
MPFPRKQLNDDENIVLDMNPHWWYYGPQAVSTAVLCILGLWILGRFGGVPLLILGYMDLAAILVFAGWLAVRVIKWRTTNFVLTNYRLISREGTLARHNLEIPLDKVNNITVHQTIFQRLIGVGEVVIDSGEAPTIVLKRKGKSDDDDDATDPDPKVTPGNTTIACVARPVFVQNAIHKAMNARTSSRFQPAPGHGDVADQLERLEGLRDRGALTDDEFEQQKRRLLG